MRIGIDCRTMLNLEGGEFAGIGHYTSALVHTLIKQYKAIDFVLFFDHHMHQETLQELQSYTNVHIRHFPLSKQKRYLPVAYSHGVVASALKRARVDLFHSPAYTIPLGYNRPSVVTVHDFAIYDHPEWFPDGQKFSREVTVPRSIARANHIIAVSAATKKQVLQHFGKPEQQVSVVYEGFTRGATVNKTRRAELRQARGIGERYLFFVSTVEPRKNVVRLVQAFDEFMEQNHERYRDLQLIIAGKKGWKSDESISAIARAKWSGNIRMIGYISHEEKVAFMQDATVFVFPTLWEGFGLPVLEALQLGTPVLTSNISALPEVAGPGAEYVDPFSEQSITQGLTRLLRSPQRRTSLAEKGKEHAKQFTWQRAGKETVAIYRSVLQDA